MADSSSGLGFLVLSQGTLVRIQYPSLAIIEYTPVPASIGYILIAFPQRVETRLEYSCDDNSLSVCILTLTKRSAEVTIRHW